MINSDSLHKASSKDHNLPRSFLSVEPLFICHGLYGSLSAGNALVHFEVCAMQDHRIEGVV